MKNSTVGKLLLVGSLSVIGCDGNFKEISDGFMVQGNVDGKYTMIEHHEGADNPRDYYSDISEEARIDAFDCNFDGDVDLFSVGNLRCYSPFNVCGYSWGETECGKDVLNMASIRLARAKEKLYYRDALEKIKK